MRRLRVFLYLFLSYNNCRVDFQVYLVLISDCNCWLLQLISQNILSECPVTCDLGLSSVYLGLAESSFGLTLPIFPTIIFYLCFNLCLTLCFTYFTYVLTYVKLCLTYASTRHMNLTCNINNINIIINKLFSQFWGWYTKLA